MSLAVTDLMVAVLVMPVGILTLVKGEFPFAPVYCLAWICLDVLFCTASIMHLCTISVDRYLSLRYPMKFGRNKTRRRVILKIVFVWLLSIAMSLPLSLMYSKDFNSVLVNGSCQIPDPLYKLIGSIVSFYIPLGVMILTYTLTVRHLAAKRQNLQTGICPHSSNRNATTARRSWRRMLRRNYRRTRSDETDVRSAAGDELTGTMTASASDSRGRERTAAPEAVAAAATGPTAAAACVDVRRGTDGGAPSAAAAAAAAASDGRTRGPPTTVPSGRRGAAAAACRHNPSVGSADTEMTSLDARELWLPDTEPAPSTMSALHQFGAEMLRLSRGLDKAASSKPTSPDRSDCSRWSDVDDDEDCEEEEEEVEEEEDEEEDDDDDDDDGACYSMCSEETTTGTPRCRRAKRQRRRRRRRRSGTLHESMRRRFDGHRRPPHHHEHHHEHHHHHHRRLPPPPRVRSFHEDELRRNRTGPTATAAAAADGAPKVVGTLLKPEYQRKPGLEEEICLLPPPPRRPRRRQRRRPRRPRSASAGDDTATPSPSPFPTPRRRAAPAERTPPPPQDRPPERTAAAEWSAASNAARTVLVADGGQPLRRAMTQKPVRKRTAAETVAAAERGGRAPLARYGSTLALPSQRPAARPLPHRSNNASRSSVMIRNSYRHGRIIRLEQKATKVLGVVFFTFVFLWTPFFALNLLPSVCPDCAANTNKGLIDLVTWLGYASSMVNPVFYTIFNKVFRQAFKRVLQCKYRGRNKRHSWPPQPAARKV